MSATLQYIYAEIDLRDNMCVGVITTTIAKEDNSDYAFVEIDSLNEDYLGRYYIDGAWYEDEAGTIPWSPEE